ncbi:MAG: radical SAM/Cys-rich domain protein [Myxococcales bacterium]|nr:radical SAM/Cys-rich domain protein [Myxococcales bacterium]
MNRFDAELTERGLAPLARGPLRTLQLNIGRRCNLACHHCHVESGPKRTEAMDDRGIERVLALLAMNPQVDTLDITGGAPELHPRFRDLVRETRRLGKRVIDRCNLTVLYEPGQENTAAFLAEQRVDVVASLPCYSLENVERQRGRGVFGRSIDALRELNGLGYGKDPERTLDLVYNPQGASLPPSQAELEATYREELDRHFGIRFNRLITIANMPIKRFAHALERDGELEAYMSLLINHFNPETVPGVMCRELVSVAYDGTLWDCDFNQMLEIPFGGSGGGSGPHTIWDVDDLGELTGRAIGTAAHCFGCTAGAGSSCGGALLES